MQNASWVAYVGCKSRAAAEVVANYLESNDVPTQIWAGGLSLGIERDFYITVPSNLAHRARWVLKISEFTDSELTYLATGELGEG